MMSFREAKKAFMARRNEPFDLVIIGGGIAGNAFAAVMAHAGAGRSWCLSGRRHTDHRDEWVTHQPEATMLTSSA